VYIFYVLKNKKRVNHSVAYECHVNGTNELTHRDQQKIKLYSGGSPEVLMN